MSRRPLLLLPAVLFAAALPIAPALAGEGDGDDEGPATLRADQGCVSGERATATVIGDNIENVRFFLDGKHIRTVTRPRDGDRYPFSVTCKHLRLGAHRARAVVRFDNDTDNQTLRFQITRTRSGSPRFAG